jgi:hypothetical protein
MESFPREGFAQRGARKCVVAQIKNETIFAFFPDSRHVFASLHDNSSRWLKLRIGRQCSYGALLSFPYMRRTMRTFLILGLVVLCHGCSRHKKYRTDDGHFITAQLNGPKVHHEECPGCQRARAVCAGNDFYSPVVQKSIVLKDGWRECVRKLYEEEFGTSIGFSNCQTTRKAARSPRSLAERNATNSTRDGRRQHDVRESTAVRSQNEQWAPVVSRDS